MKQLILAVSFLLCQAAYASELFPPRAEVLYLADVKREPRSWKCLKLVPGRILTYYYACTDEKGNVIIRHSDTPLKDHLSHLTLAQSHPNLYVFSVLAIPAATVIGGGANMFTAFK